MKYGRAKKEDAIFDSRIPVGSTMKVAVIGCGHWGKKQIEEYIALDTDVVAIDLIEDNLKFVKEKYDHIKTTSNYHDILDKETNNQSNSQSDKDRYIYKDIEAVSICTPNRTHYQIAKDCLLANKNVLVEKPLSMTVEQGRELINIAKDNNLILTVGHIFRFNNAIKYIKEMIDDYQFGEIRIVKLKWTNVEPLSPMFEDRDVIFDLAPHPFDIINFLFNRNPDEISCIGNAYRRSIDKGVESVFINSQLKEIIINIELSWITPPKTRSLTIIGSKKIAIVNCISQSIAFNNQPNSNQSIEFYNNAPNNTIRDELQSFLDCIHDKDKQNISDGSVGLDIVKMIDICQKSLKEKRTMKFEWN